MVLYILSSAHESHHGRLPEHMRTVRLSRHWMRFSGNLAILLSTLVFKFLTTLFSFHIVVFKSYIPGGSFNLVSSDRTQNRPE